MAMVQQANVQAITGTLSIKQFLLAYALGGDADVDLDESGGIQTDDRSRHRRTRLRAEIERHNDRTMTVVTLSGTETITRCGICPKTNTAPCIGLRRIAAPYAGHPAFQPEWRI